VGSPEIMAAQMAHLARVGRLPNPTHPGGAQHRTHRSAQQFRRRRALRLRRGRG
jgi:hypothetical protein